MKQMIDDHLARLIHEFAKNFHNFIFYNQNLGQKCITSVFTISQIL